eukprot:TRINITY_DN8345_c0_g1_i1.p1 TRINITY_DN8345_c0_g1~~TRINITY_DN8345_c0_g1_i1.p1  ORF type:complete len:1720 (-),score=519.06 TRINITY_DN8345_c0_g1_i1:23-5182(-)
MSTLLIRWLNEDVELSHNITSLEQDFANGYYFGELLYRYSLQPDFKHFKNVQSAEAIVDNFVRLEPTLRSLNILFESKTVNEVMTQQRGVAAKLLYQIRTVLEGQVTTTGQGKKERTVHVSNPEAKGRFREMQHKFFEERLRSKYSESIVNGKMNMHLNKFEQEKRRKEEQERLALQRDKELAEEKVHQRRQAIVQRDRENKQLLDGWEQEGKAAHRRAMKAKRDQEKRDLEFELAVAASKEARKVRAKKEAAEDMSGGIDAFEKNLQRLRSEKNPGAAGAAPAATGSTATNNTLSSTLSAVEHAQKLQEQLPSTREMMEQAKKYTANIKEKKAQEIWARKERQQRRRKLMLEESNAHRHLENKRMEDDLLDKLLRRSAEERRVASQLMAVREEKEQIRRNRIIRQQQYAERRERDYQESLARDAEWGRQQRAEYQEKAKQQESRLAEHKRRLADIKHAKHTEFCLNLVGEIVKFAGKIGHHVESHGDLVPPPLYREWNEHIIKGIPLPDDPTDDAVAAQVLESTDSAIPTFLDDAELEEYVQHTGTWSLPEGNEVEPEPANDLMDAMVSELLALTAPPEPEPEDPELPPFPIKVSILGKPFSGQSSVSSCIAKKYDLTVIVPDEVVSDALRAHKDGEEKLVPLTEEELEEARQAKASEATAAADNEDSAQANEGGDDDDDTIVPFRSEPSDRNVLGGQIDKLLSSGKAVGDDLVAKCVADRIRRIANTPGERQGWILDGYPRTLEQAQLLEHELTGYVIPPKKKGGKGKPQAKAPAKAGKKSKIAPNAAAPEAAEQTLVSGLDAVVILDVEDDLAVRRCTGRRIDPETNTEYHLEFNPPPEDPEFIASLVVPEDNENVAKNLTHRLAAFTKEQPLLRSHFDLFGTWHDLEASRPVTEVADEASAIFQSILDQRAAEEEQRKAEEAAAAEEARAAAEAQAAKEKEEKAAAEAAARAAAEEEAAKAAAGGKGKKAKEKSKPAPVASAATPVTDAADDASTGDEAKPFDPELAVILMEQWDSVEKLYCDRLKEVFTGLRHLRKAALVHGGACRRHFSEYLRRPHNMQSVITAFQVAFNQIPAHLRAQLDTKDELHLRLSQLKEDLWAISDQRRDEAEEERAVLVKPVWKDRHCEMIVDRFVALLQVELDRFQSAVQVSTDFYKAKHNQIPEEASPTSKFVDLRALLAAEPATKKKGGDKGDKKKGKDAPQEEEAQYLNSLRHAFTTARAALSGDGGDDGKKSKKKGASGGDDKKSKKGKDKNAPAEVEVHEIAECIERETALATARFARLEAVASAMITSVEQRHQQLASEFKEWVAKQFRDEVNSTSGLCDHIAHSIESAEPLQEEIRCIDGAIVVNSAVHTVPDPPAPVAVAPEPVPDAMQFRCSQISALAQKFARIAPTGAMKTPDFVSVLLHFAGTSDGTALFPEEWLTYSRKHLQALAQSFEYLKRGYVDYKSFLCRALPIARPTQSQLKLALTALSAADSEGRGLITRERFHQVPLWFDKVKSGIDSPVTLRDTLFDVLAEREPLAAAVELDPAEQASGDANGSDRDAGSVAEAEPLLSYEALLLHLCMGDTALEGLRMAASILADPLKGDDMVSVEDLYRILHHGTGVYTVTDSGVTDPVPLELLQTICQSLNLGTEPKLSIDMLRKNATGMQVSQGSTNFQFQDIYQFMGEETANEGLPVAAISPPSVGDSAPLGEDHDDAEANPGSTMANEE